MPKKRPHSDSFADLRRRAEEKARADAVKTGKTPSPEEAGRLIHELQVHQIELEMQNEELRRAQSEVDASRARYFELYDLAPVGYFTISEQGLILEANLAGAVLLGVRRSDLVKRSLPRFIAPEDQDIYYRHRKRLVETGEPQVCELRMLHADATPFWVRLEATAAHDASGAPVCRTVMSDISERKQAEEEIESLARFPGENPNPVARIGEDARLLYANPPAAALLRSLGCAVDGTAPSIWCDWIRQTRDKLAAHPIDWEHEGHTYAIEIAHFAQAGYANVYARDVTEGKRAEKALSEANERLELRVQERTVDLARVNRSLQEEIDERHRAEEVVKAERKRLFEVLETLPVYVVLLSRDRRVIFANRSFRERFGESLDGCCFEGVLRGNESCGDCIPYESLKTGEPHRWQASGLDGRRYDVHDSLFRDTDGSTLLLEVGVDITDRENAEDALVASEARYRSFVTASMQIIWSTDSEGSVVDDLPTWRAFTGQSIEQIRGWGWLDALHPDDRERAASAWSQALATGSMYAIEYRVRRHDGRYRLLSVHGVPVIKEGTIREWVGACTDNTEQRTADEETRRLKDELAHVERTARMGELAASLAHEINQPLTAILSNAQAARRLLASAAPDLDMFHEILGDIIGDAKRAGNVIHRLRRMIQKEKHEPERLDVNDAVREVVQLLQSEAIGRHVEILTDLAPELPAVWAERIEVQQVIVNLLLNALDAFQGAPPGRREILIRTGRDENAVVVAVRDSGCGIQSPEIDSIFESYFTTKPAGLGMGLAICRRMIQAHGGRIWAANNEGAGATFAFALPLTVAGREPDND